MEVLGVSAVLLLACVVFFLLNILHTSRLQGKGKLPPGPTPWPFLGNILQICGKDTYKSFFKLGEKYGPIYTIYMGQKPIVILTSCDAVKEALIYNGEKFIGRGYTPLMERITLGHGLSNSSGERWKQLRNFSLMTMRNFGMGKRSIEERIQEEAQFLLEEIRKTKGHPVDPTFYFSKAVSNIIASVVFGERFEYEDKQYLYLLDILNKIFSAFSSVSVQMYNVYPNIVEKLPGLHNQMFKGFEQIKTLVAQRVKTHQETLDPNSPRDFIDCFLIKMEQEKDMPESEFHMDALLNTMVDFVVAGTETVSTTLRYGFLILLKNPDVEERVKKEIDQVIGQNREPGIEDRSKMPYTDAVIHEIQRFIDLIPLGLPRKVTCDVFFRDYVIPKGTTVYPILSTVLRDPKQFKNPNQFNPGHFLDANGKFRKNDGFLPFSAGKRICAGEGLARMELFLFISIILQNFSLKSVVDIEELDLTPQISGFGSIPRSYKICFIPR
ncbi:cytochrome P450 2G1-like isoform X1 [Bombina bombina]|uniref:cytochrome P450 2G1-like isoform X1 n=1 Tax=Bombina bombina TaxID=8345 RepID=UPI00235A7205|nr:cytochrome P450 2G1-like isoform X1 [Bombina bombina]